MSNSGSPNAETTAKQPIEESSSSGSLRRQRLYLLLAAMGLLVAAYIGVQLFVIVYGLVFPPDAPVPDGSTLIEHENFAYGVDEWLYGTQVNPCDVVTFYLESDANCRVSPGQCGIGITDPVGQSVQNVATCSGNTSFSIFDMGWEVTIAAGYRTGDPTRFRLRREVFWIGTSSNATQSN